ncbi:MAG: hypothetical protein HY831_04240 [Candidatus Aenigmarchaeota archaeon]|nr:hypothetical protein [Candidatus Aenigmarchaeota archaeon]
MILTNDNETKTAKSLIINILSKEQKLSTKQIFDRSSGISYSNIYKALDILITQGKIKKIDGKISLNIEWVKELGRFSEKVQKIYSHEYVQSLNDFKQEHDSKTLKFENLAKADEFRKKLQLEYIQLNRKDPYIGIYKHLRSPIIDPELSLGILETIKENNIKSFLVVSSDTKMDRWCAKFYARNPNVNIKTGVSLQSMDSCEIMILGDVVVQMSIPNEINYYLEKIYTSSRSIDDIDAIDFYENVYKTKIEVKIVILKNKIISDHIRNEIINLFK